MELAGCTLADYELLLGSLELSPGGRALPSCLFHWVEHTSVGIRVREVWADRATFELVLVDFVLPALTLLGLPSPRIELNTVQNYLVGDPGVSIRRP
jgi:hypothetical protein